VLQGEGTDTVQTKNGQIVLQIEPLVGAVKELDNRGISFFDDVELLRHQERDRHLLVQRPEDHPGPCRSPRQVGAHPADRHLRRVRGGNALSGNRRRTVLRGALGVALAMGVLLTAFNLGRNLYLDALPTR
jgi:hypothetical protein